MPWSDRIGRRVKLRDLHVLLAVAETRSMAKAAQRLAISQPVVSKTIADLEHAVGVRLFDRTSQGVEPTAYGHSFIHCGTAVFDEMRRGVQDIEFLADPTAGEVRIGVGPPFVDFVTAAVARLASRYPHIQWYVTESDTPVCCRMLRERKIDVGIGRLGSSVAGDLDSDTLYEDHMSVVAGLDNRWARRRRIDLADLAGDAWVLPEANSVAWLWIDEIFRSVGVTTPDAPGDLQLDVGAHWSGRNRPLPHHGDAIDAAFRRGEPEAENLADADTDTTGGHHHHQEPHAESDRDALHQGIAGPCETAGEREVVTSTTRICKKHNRRKCPLLACAVKRRRFPVGASPTRQPLQPEATGAVMEVTKWLKPSDSVSRYR